MSEQDGVARTAAREIVEAFLSENDLEWEPGAAPDEFVVTLPGEKKLKTVASLRLGDRDLRAQAFVIRHPDENVERFHAYLMRANLRLRGIAYGIDELGDVYLTGRVPLTAVEDRVLDELLGSLLAAADGAFNDLLIIGFMSSIRKEWRWRVSRGESTANLEAFRHLLDGPADSLEV